MFSIFTIYYRLIYLWSSIEIVKLCLLIKWNLNTGFKNYGIQMANWIIAIQNTDTNQTWDFYVPDFEYLDPHWIKKFRCFQVSAKLIIVSEHIREIFNELDASSEVVEFRLTFHLPCRLFEYRALWWPAFSWPITGKDLKSRYVRIWNGQKEVAFNWSILYLPFEIWTI